MTFFGGNCPCLEYTPPKSSYDFDYYSNEHSFIDNKYYFNVTFTRTYEGAGQTDLTINDFHNFWYSYGLEPNTELDGNKFYRKPQGAFRLKLTSGQYYDLPVDVSYCDKEKPTTVCSNAVIFSYVKNLFVLSAALLCIFM